MAKSKIDWAVLRGAGITFAGVISLGAMLMGGSYYFRSEMQSEFTREQRNFFNISRKYLAVDEEERLVKVYFPQFKQLEENGMVGDEQRLNWTESLRNISNRLRLPSLRYNIEPQEEFEPTYSLSAGTFRPYASRMRLEIGLLHEEDLFRLFRELGKEARGRFSVENCAFQRKSQRITKDPKAANVQVKCDLLWLTIRKPA